jgi:RimJ/RimL family protein N-acetyltransferase
MKIPPITLQGRIVRLEALSHAHHDGLCRVVKDGDLWKLNVTLVPSPEEMESWINEELQAQDQGNDQPFTIILHSTNEIVGCTRYCHIEPSHRKLEIRTWIAHSWQKTEVNTESKLLLLQYAFEVLKYIRVEFVADVLNEVSFEALKRIGAKYEGTLRNHMIMRGGRYRDSYVLSIIDSDWPEVKTHILHLLETRPYEHHLGREEKLPSAQV